LLRRFRLGAGATYRDGIFKYHTAKIFYSSTSIGASIAELNPDYFLDGRTSQQHFTLQYDFTIDKRDVKAYPIKGYKLSLSAQKDGFGSYKVAILLIDQSNLMAIFLLLVMPLMY